MRDRVTFRLTSLVVAAAASVTITGCVPLAAPQSPTPQAPNAAPTHSPGESSGESSQQPSPGASATKTTKTTQSQPEELPGEGEGFGKCFANTLSMRIAPVDTHTPGPTRYGDLFIANVGTKACNLTTYPGMKLIGYKGHHTDTKVEHAQPDNKAVKLQPGERVRAALEWTRESTDNDKNWGPCSPGAEPTAADVIPPDTKAPVRVPWSFGPVCDGGKIIISQYEPA